MSSLWSSCEETKLISYVQENQSIWQKTHPDYLNTYRNAKIWDGIAKNMDRRKADVQKRWKSLKRRMATEFRSIPKTKSGDSPSCQESKWIHYKSMTFVIGDLVYKKPSGNLSGMKTESMKRSESDSENDECYMSTGDWAYKETEKDQEKSMQELESIATKGKKVEIKEKEDYKSEEDNDQKFFETLIPYMNAILPESKLKLTQEMTEVIFKYAYERKSQKRTKFIEENDDEVQFVRQYRSSYPPHHSNRQGGQYGGYNSHILLPIKKEEPMERPGTHLTNITNRQYQFHETPPLSPQVPQPYPQLYPPAQYPFAQVPQLYPSIQMPVHQAPVVMPGIVPDQEHQAHQAIHNHDQLAEMAQYQQQKGNMN